MPLFCGERAKDLGKKRNTALHPEQSSTLDWNLACGLRHFGEPTNTQRKHSRRLVVFLQSTQLNYHQIWRPCATVQAEPRSLTGTCVIEEPRVATRNMM